MASIEKRGDNKYRIIVSCGYGKDDKKITKKKTVEMNPELTPRQLEKELNATAALFEQEVKSGNYVDTRLTFAKFADRWLSEYAEKRLEKTTVESYRMHLNTKILPAIGYIKLSELKAIDIIKFLDNLTEDGVRMDKKPGGYSTRIIKYQHSIISTILQTAVFWQIINENVARRVRPPKGAEKKNSENFFNEDQIKAFLEYVLETEPIQYQALAFVTAYGGLRKGEVLGITWKDVDFKQYNVSINKSYTRTNREEFIKTTKNQSSNRTVALPPVVFSLLGKFISLNKEDRVFPLPYSTPTRWFTEVIKRYNKSHEEKLPENVTFHGLRHTSATLLIAQGLDIKSVSARLGHNDTSTTLNIYAHAIQSRDKAASDALDNLINIKTVK